MDQKLIGNRIKSRRTALDLTLGDVASAIGVAISTVQRYEAGTIDKMKLPVLDAIARKLQVSPAWLIGKSEELVALRETLDTDALLSFPVLRDTLETGSAQETIQIPRSYLGGHAPDRFFVIEVRDHVMQPLYHAGDRVLLLRQDTLDHSGDIAAVRCGDGPILLRRVDYVAGKDWMRLSSPQSLCPEQVLEGAALAACRILGVPRLLLRMFS